MFRLNDVGRMAWRTLGEAPLGAIVNQVVAAFDVSHDVAAADVRALLEQRLRAGLPVDAA